MEQSGEKENEQNQKVEKEEVENKEKELQKEPKELNKKIDNPEGKEKKQGEEEENKEKEIQKEKELNQKIKEKMPKHEEELTKKNKEEEKEEIKEKQNELLNNKKNEEQKEIKKEQSSEELEKLIDYKYNEAGELLHKETGKKVNKLSQKEYELVGKYVQKYVEELLIKKFNLTILYVPNNKSTDYTKRDESQAQCKILTTKDFPKNQKCLLLIQGTGAVRLGQWARSVCINENIDLGSMIPYVEKAINNQFSVIIFNPNERRDFLYEENKIKEFTTMERHSVYVYNNIVKTNDNIKDIYIVAHSMGGACTVEILLNNKEDLLNGKIKKIAFTDSVHGEEYKDLGIKGIEQFRKISRNYVCSKKKAGEFERDYTTSYGGVDCYSSGHNKHEYTSGYAIDEIFKYFNSNE